MPVSTVVDRASAAADAAEAADTKTPPSDEVRAESSGGSVPKVKAATQKELKKMTAKEKKDAEATAALREEAPVRDAERKTADERAAFMEMHDTAEAAAEAVKPAKAKAAKAAPKYSPELRASAARAREIRGRSNSVAPLTVTRVQAALGKTDPGDVVKAFKSIKAATEFAAGDKSIETPALVKELGEKIEDPFARGRGLVAICLALAGK
jgi:hypothetical protein